MVRSLTFDTFGASTYLSKLISDGHPLVVTSPQPLSSGCPIVFILVPEGLLPSIYVTRRDTFAHADRLRNDDTLFEN